MPNLILQSLFAPKKRLLTLIAFCFCISIAGNAQNLLTSNNNNPGFEGAGGFQTNGYTDVSPGSSGTSSDGNYALTGSSGPMNTTSFNNVLPHSGSKMMVIDANNDIFWKQYPNIQLQGGIKYTFSYWVVNINKNGTSNGAFPNPVIQFNAFDNCGCTPVLKSGSATVNNATWQQVVYEFTPSGTGPKWVRIELSTPAASPNGNDFAIDDLSLTEPPLPLSISTSQTAISCPGLNDGSISAYGFGGVQPYSYKLTPPVGLAVTSPTGIFTNLASGSYKVEVFDSNGPVDSAFKNVTINSVLDMTIAGSIPANSALVPATSTQPLSTTICAGNTITLAANNMTGYTWSATPADPSLTVPSSASISVTPTVNTVYKVTATGPTGALSNLVYNGDFENDVAGFSSDYKYLATNPAFEKRTYGVITNPNIWGSVYDSSLDHTNPGTGKFFITDGSTSTPIIDKVWGQNIAVKSGVTYDFNYFLRTITSTSPTLPAKMQLKINGVVINNTASSSTDVAPATTAGGWVTYKHTWTAGVGVTIATIELYDIETSGAGNDFGLDDITFIAQGVPTCTVSKEITVNISPGTSDTAFTYPAAVCQTSTSLMPTKTTPATFTSGGTWSKSSAGGTLSINSSTGEINPSLSTAGTFTVKYEVFADASICQAAGSSTFDITINPVPVIVTTPGGFRCGTGIVSMSATATSGATINWYTTLTGGSSFATGSTVNTPASISTTTTYYVEASLNGCTTSARTAVVATINTIPTITGTTPNSRCGAGTVTLGATASAGTINWYSAASGGTSLGTGTSFVTPSITATTAYYIDATVGTCTTTSRTPIAATVNAVPILSINCGTSTATSVTFNWNSIADATSYSYSYSVASGTPVTGSVSSATTTYTVNGLTSGQVVAITITPVGSTCGLPASGNCQALSCPLPTVDPIASIPVCSNQTVTVPSFTSNPAGATFNWFNNNTSIGLASNGIGDILSFTAVNTTTTVQTATITVTANNGICTGPAITFDIIVNPLPTASISGSTLVCSGTGTNIAFVGTPNVIVTYTLNSVINTISLDAGGNATVATGNLTATASYDLVSVFNPVTGCSQAQTGNATVTINGLPIASVSGSTSVCSGTGTNITFAGTPNAVVTYMLNSVTNTITLDAGGNATLGTGNITATASYDLVSVLNPATGCSQAQTGNATVTINALPIVSISGSTSVCSGTGTNIAFVGTPNAIVTYTLNSVINTISLDAGGNATLGTGNITATASYDLVSALNPVTGCSQAQTGNATVTVNSLPIASISGSTSVCSGTGTNIAFVGTPNAIVTYTLNSVINTISLDAGGNATVATGNLTATASYDLVSVFNPVTGCSQAQTGNATVTINGLPIASVSGSTSVCSGTGTNITFAGTPNAVVTYMLNSVTNTITLDAGGNATVATGNITATASYDLVSVLNPATACSQAQTGNATVTINALPIVSISGSTSVCFGTGTNIAFAGTPNAIVTYTLNSAANTITLDAGGNATVATGNLTATASYDLVSVLNPATGCSQPQTGNATVTVNALPIATATPISQTICSGEQTGIVLSSTVPNTTFNWTIQSQAGATGAVAGSGNNIAQVLTATGITLGTVIYTITPTANGCIGNSIQVTIDVTPAPKATATPNSQSICSGDTTSFVLSSDLVGTTYDWNVVQTNVTGASAGSGTVISQVLTTVGNNAGQAVYTITPKLNGCYGTPVSVVIDVNPIPVVSANPTSETLCSGETTNIALSTTNVVGATFTWTVSQTGVAGASSGSGNMINQMLTATGPVQGTVDYTITPLKNGCSGVPVTVTVTVNPTPEVFGPASTTICSGESPNISLSPSIVGTTFDWIVVQSGVTGAVDGSGDTINQILETSGTTQGSVIYRVTPTLDGCVGTPLDIRVLVNPLPLPELTDGVICVDQATNVAFQTYTLDTGLSSSSYNFEWYFENVLIAGVVTSTYEAALEGKYEVIATNKVTGCVSSPVSANVTASFPGESIATIQTPAFAEDATITVTVTGGNGTYEYKLDDGAFQTSNVFTNVTAGPHTVTVGDTNGCTNLSQDVFIIGYPKFFTPNGDGFNDSWNLVGLIDQPQAKIYIFDRYGKLLKQISSAGDGWDGTYTGQLMPATDYWFTVEYTELSATKIFRAHFSLLR